jgi:hypothetical protein
MKVISRKSTKSITPLLRHTSSASSVTTEVVGTVTEDAMWREYHVATYAAEEVPPGWITPYRYAEINGINFNQASAFLRREAGRGVLEARKFRIKTGAGEYRAVTHFRFLKPRK